MRQKYAWQWLAAVLVLAGCDRQTDHGEQGGQAAGEASERATASGSDQIGAMLRRLKDLLADGQTREAERLMRELERMRPNLSASRQAEIDRLDAMFAGER